MPFILQKIADEGTSEPFYARLWLGIMELRDHALRERHQSGRIEAARLRFDGSYEPVLHALSASRKSARAVGQLVEEHYRKVTEGRIVSFQGHAVMIGESIDEQLKDEFSTFLNSSVRAMKGIDKVISHFDLSVAALFSKPEKFKKRLEQLRRAGHPKFAQFLQEVRETWPDQLMARRNALEHEGWQLGPVRYGPSVGGTVEAVEPEVDGEPITTYVSETLSRTLRFVEDCVVYAFRSALRFPITIVEIPQTARDPSCPKRFRLEVSRPGIVEWEIQCTEPYEFA
jgi:hypothetical protein